MKEIWEERLGRVEIFPDGPVVAGSQMEWTLTYTVGSYGVDEGGVLMLVKRLACDMEHPQFDHPAESGYTTIVTDGDCRLAPRFQRKQHPRPWHNWCLVIDVTDGYLSQGDSVKLILGNRSQGSPGIRAQSFVESQHEFRWLVDPTNAANPQRLPSSPIIPIIAGKPVRLVCLLPSLLIIGENAKVFVKGEDAWGNPISPPDGIKLNAKGSGGVRIEGNTLKAESSGIVWVEAAGNGFSCFSNPLEVVKHPQNWRPFWADLHGQTGNTVGTGSVEEFFDFARDWGRLDVVGHQGNDFQITTEAWQQLNATIMQYQHPGELIVLPGYEWSGNTSAGGDHNVYFLEDDPPILRSSHWQVPQVPEGESSPAHPVNVLFERLKGLQRFHSMVVPHVGGRYGNTKRYFDPELESVVEIVSCHGVFEWFLWDALEAGLRVGVVCNSDGHKGRPGAEGPGAGHFGVKGGLTCVLAEELTREAIFDALKKRRCYGTTGPRMSLWIDADGHPMGTEFAAASSVTINAIVHGTAPLESLTLYRGKQPVHQVRPSEFDKLDDSPYLRVFWEGARIRGRGRRAVWDGEISVDGAEIVSAKAFAFDSPADGILETKPNRVSFRSRTVGDRDGIELRLTQARDGRIFFNTQVGSFSINLDKLGPEGHVYDYGGLGLKAGVYRYPVKLLSRTLKLERIVKQLAGMQTYLVKAVQSDGNMAWTSPIFIKG